MVYQGLPGIDTAEIIINNCILTDNTAQFGGAITFNSTYRDPTTLCITNSLFSDNYASNGGGAIYLPPINTSISYQIDNTIFDNNQVNAGSGGAIYDINNLTNWTFNRSAFTNNRIDSGDGGAIALWNQASNRTIRFLDTDFDNNWCSTDGGALGYIHEVEIANLSAIFESCRFQQNTGQFGAGGVFLLPR
ncbi:MAG: hypothetical protein R2795_00770 [Saprospiraceae bacterium]